MSRQGPDASFDAAETPLRTAAAEDKGRCSAKAGVPLRTAQAAMRHSDPSLTANVYTDPKLLDVAGAVASSPDLPLDRCGTQHPSVYPGTATL